MVSIGTNDADPAHAATDLALVAGGRRWSRKELAEAVGRERERLASVGALDAGLRCVAFDAHPTPGSVVRLLALLEAGACAAPLHPRISAAERSRRLRVLAPARDLDAGAVRGGGGTEGGPGGMADGRDTEEPDAAVRWRRRPGAAEGADASGDRPQAILFTSGSSGAPRAVELSRAAFRAAAAASAAHLGWKSDDRWLCCLPLAHVGGLSIVVRCTLAGRPIVLTRGFEPGEVVRVIEAEQVTLASFVPTMLHQLFAARPDWTPPDALRAVLLGGAAAGPGLWEEIARRDVPALATYGMTETCAQVATAKPGDPRRLLPLPGIDVRVVDGRIEVAGPTLCTALAEIAASREDRETTGAGVDTPDASDASGAWSSSEAASPWTADGYLRTADLGRVESGALVVLARADDVIVTGGENVAPASVERVLEALPAVRRAVVFGVPDEEWGELVVAALEREPTEAPLALDELRPWLEARLASYERPRRVAWLDELPETPSGKTDRTRVIEACRTGLVPL